MDRCFSGQKYGLGVTRQCIELLLLCDRRGDNRCGGRHGRCVVRVRVSDMLPPGGKLLGQRAAPLGGVQ